MLGIPYPLKYAMPEEKFLALMVVDMDSSSAVVAERHNPTEHFFSNANSLQLDDQPIGLDLVKCFLEINPSCKDNFCLLKRFLNNLGQVHCLVFRASELSEAGLLF